MVKKKRKNSKGGLRRKNDEYPGLDKKNHPRTRAEYIDYDFIKELSPDEKAWLSKFTDEYYGASLAKKEDWTGRRKDFHRLKKERKACRDRNNARLRDVVSLNKAINKVDSTDDKLIKLTEVRSSNPGRHEDSVIALLDLKMELEKKDT